MFKRLLLMLCITSVAPVMSMSATVPETNSITLELLRTAGTQVAGATAYLGAHSTKVLDATRGAVAGATAYLGARGTEVLDATRVTGAAMAHLFRDIKNNPDIFAAGFFYLPVVSIVGSIALTTAALGIVKCAQYVAKKIRARNAQKSARTPNY